MKYHYLAFIDILGFSKMVISDVEGPSTKYQELLFDNFNKTKLKFQNENAELIQFSDSVILTRLYNKDEMQSYIELIADYQYELLKEGILLRGGITYGKHFHSDGFLYSKALIDSYLIERDVAKYPRIVVSKDLMELTNSINPIPDAVKIIKENDNQYFVDYLEGKDEKEVNDIYNKYVNISQSPSVMEKYSWLKDYIKHKFPAIDTNNHRFVK